MSALVFRPAGDRRAFRHVAAEVLEGDFPLLLREVQLLGPVGGRCQVGEHLGHGHHALGRAVVVLVFRNVLRHQDRVLAHGPEAVCHVFGAVTGHRGNDTAEGTEPEPGTPQILSSPRRCFRGGSADHLRGAVEDAVEQELEGAVRLRAEGDLGPDQEHLALAERDVDAGGAAIEIVLAPRPAGPQRLLRIEPRHRLHAARAPRSAPAASPGCSRRTRRPASRSRTRAGWCCPRRRA